MPIDMRMLTYYHETLEDNAEKTDRSNLSSAESVNSRLNRTIDSTPESEDTVGHAKNSDHVFKPFKKENKQRAKNEQTSVSLDFELEQKDESGGNKTAPIKKDTAAKDFNSFFMTQIDQEESPQTVCGAVSAESKSEPPAARAKKNEEKLAKSYDFLFNIENEHQIKVPKGIQIFFC